MNKKKYISNFGVKILISKAIRKPFYNKNSHFSKGICLINEKIIKNFLINNINFDSHNEKLNKKKIEYNSIIWTMWWQGLENAPLLVQKCIEKMQNENPNHKVIIITKKNYNDYVELPDHVIHKIENNNISITHFSDILRVNLLYQYGGIWADSTLFMTKSIPEEYFNKEFYTINTGIYTNDPSHGRWTTFFIESHRGSKLMKFLVESFNSYLDKYDQFIDYILFDYFIEIGYENNTKMRKYIDSVPKNNQNVFKLQEFLSEPIDEFNYENCDTFLYKLSYKAKLSTKSDNGKASIYSKITNS